MKCCVYSLKGTKKSDVVLPEQFNEEYRPDMIKRAVLSLQANRRQPYGANEQAGMKTSAEHVARRSIYGSWANKGYSRMPRIRVGSGHMTGKARRSPHAVKGRTAHPPKTEKNWTLKINKKENRKAIRSAISATVIKELVEVRNHVLDKIKDLPLVIEDKFETLKKTKDVKEALDKLGLSAELERTSERKIRAGKGKMRGRKYKTKKGPLLVISGKKEIEKAAGNIPGVNIVAVKNLNAELLAPGTVPGRLTVWTEGAIEAIKKEKLFM